MQSTSRISVALVALLLTGLPAAGQKQVNMLLRGHLDLAALGDAPAATCRVSPADPGSLDVRVNDVWGWDGPGPPLALVGLCDGTAIVDVGDPDAPALAAKVPGPRSVWRDIKTFDHYAYIVHDVVQPGEVGVGVQIVDLELPGFPVVGTLADVFSRAHNLYVDAARGHLYVVGWDADAAGLLDLGGHPEHDEAGFTHGFRVYDLTGDPEAPAFLGQWDEQYAHDLHVRGTTAYVAALADGLWLVDVSDPAAPASIAGHTYTQDLPGGATLDQLTHNVWASEDGGVAAVTDEQLLQRVKLFDVSDPAAVAKLSEYEAKPGILPHNAFIRDGKVYVSYYSEGAVVLDIADPAAPCEIGYYDTYLGASAQNGAWGIYPFTASGLIYVSDISSGLYVFEHRPPARDPVDVALVLDVSGSMDEISVGGAAPRIEVLRDAVELFVETWRRFTVPEDRLGIVYFESAVEPALLDGAISTLFCPHHREFVDDVRDHPTGNLTALGGGVLSGVRSFEAGAVRRHAIVVTDGMQNVSPIVTESGIEVVFFDLGDTLVEPGPGGFVLKEGAVATVEELLAEGVQVGVITTFPGDRDALNDALRNEAAEVDPAAFLGTFDGPIVTSGEAGFDKPDPRIYEAAAADLGSPPPPSHIAFVTEELDDIADLAVDPTAGARALGWVGIWIPEEAAPPNPRANHTLAPGALPSILDIVTASRRGGQREIVTAPIGSGVYAESGVPGAPGTTLAELGPKMHTIGIGTVPGSRWQELIAAIADETGGVHHFTSAPDAELQDFLEDALVPALQAGSVYRVARRTGAVAAKPTEVPETLDFELPPTASKVAIRLSWRGARRAGVLETRLLRLDPGAGAPLAIEPSDRVRGDFYQVESFELSVRRPGLSLPAAGSWRLEIRPAQGLARLAPLPYSVSVLVDDGRLRTRLDAPAGELAAGSPIPLAAAVTLDGAPLAGADVRVRVSRPGAGLGSALSEAGGGGAGAAPGESFDPVELRLRELVLDPAFRARLAPRSVELTLAEQADGGYRGVLEATTVPGSYRFDWRAEGEVEGERFVRTGSFARTVVVRGFDGSPIALTAEPPAKGLVRVRLAITPRDGLGNHLGPGYSDRIRFVVPGVATPRAVDRFDGSYAAEVVLDDPAVLYDAGVSVLGERLPLPEEAVDGIVGGSGRGLSGSFHVGSTHPLGSIGGPADANIYVAGDLGYAFADRWQLRALVGLAQLTAESAAAIDHPRWLHGSLLLRHRFPPRPSRLTFYLQGGPGVYWPKSGASDPGFALGLGAEIPLGAPFRLELGADLHRISDAADTELLTLQLGVSFR